MSGKKDAYYETKQAQYNSFIKLTIWSIGVVILMTIATIVAIQ